MKTLVLRRQAASRVGVQYVATGDAARALAREIFHSERVVREGKLRLSVANVFAAAASALGRGEAVEIRDAADVVAARCTPGDSAALADEFRAAGRGAAADAWLERGGAGALSSSCLTSTMPRLSSGGGVRERSR